MLVCKKIMIVVPFFYNTSIYGNEKPITNNRGNSACKYLEFFALNYAYIRHFLPKNEHLFILDNGSPINILDFLEKFVSEPYEIIKSNVYTISNLCKLHIKRFDNILKVGTGNSECGVVRMLTEFLKICYFNKENFLLIEGDCLISYNLLDDCKNNDFVTYFIRWIGRSISMYTTFVSYKNLSFFDQFELLPDFLDRVNSSFHYNIKSLMSAEGGFFREFYINNIAEFSNKQNILHDENDLNTVNFLIKFPVNSFFYSVYIDFLKKRINFYANS